MKVVTKQLKELKMYENNPRNNDQAVDGRPYEEIVEIARDYIKAVGGFEKFAEWGLY